MDPKFLSQIAANFDRANQDLISDFELLNPPIRSFCDLFSTETIELVRLLSNLRSQLNHLPQLSPIHLLTLITEFKASAAKYMLENDVISQNENKISRGVLLAYSDTHFSHREYTTGLSPLNSLFRGGGFPCGRVVELLGSENSGKTQICLSTAVASAIDGFKVLYIDTHNNFPMKRFKSIVSHRVTQFCVNLNQSNESVIEDKIKLKEVLNTLYSEVISRIFVVKLFDFFELLTYLTQLQSKNIYHIIIIDDLQSLLLPLLSQLHPLSNSGGAPAIQYTEKLNAMLANMVVVLKSITSNPIQSTVVIANRPSTFNVSRQSSHSASSRTSLPNHPVRALPFQCLDELIDISLHCTVTLDHDSQTAASAESDVSTTKSPREVILIDVLLRPPFYGQRPLRAKVTLESLLNYE